MPKPKTGIKKPGAGNPNPVQNEKLKEKQFKAAGKIPGDYPLGKKTWGITLPIDVERYLNEMNEEDRDKRIEWMRVTLIERARREMKAKKELEEKAK